jgi:hypothetical protein
MGVYLTIAYPIRNGGTKVVLVGLRRVDVSFDLGEPNGYMGFDLGVFFFFFFFS